MNRVYKFTDEDLAVVLCNLELDRAKTLAEVIPDDWDDMKTWTALRVAANTPKNSKYRGLCSCINEGYSEVMYKLTPEGDAWLCSSGSSYQQRPQDSLSGMLITKTGRGSSR